MAKFIIETFGNIPDALALHCVSQVVDGGKVSKQTVNGEEVPAYCFHTSFTTQLPGEEEKKVDVVMSRVNRSGSIRFVAYYRGEFYEVNHPGGS